MTAQPTKVLSVKIERVLPMMAMWAKSHLSSLDWSVGRSVAKEKMDVEDGQSVGDDRCNDYSERN